MDCFNFGKGVGQGYILSSCLFNFYAEYIMLNARLDDSQAGIKIARWNINNLRYTDDIALATKISIVKAMIFPVVMHRCECWTIKKAEHWRIDAFKLQCWRRLLRVLWAAMRSNQSILKEINPEYSLEGLMLKLKFLYFSHLMRRANSLKKTLNLGKIKDRRRKRWQRTRWLDSIINSMDMSLRKLW